MYIYICMYAYCVLTSHMHNSPSSSLSLFPLSSPFPLSFLLSSPLTPPFPSPLLPPPPRLPQSSRPPSPCLTRASGTTSPTRLPSSSPVTANTAPTNHLRVSSFFPRASNSFQCIQTASSSRTLSCLVSETL